MLCLSPTKKRTPGIFPTSVLVRLRIQLSFKPMLDGQLVRLHELFESSILHLCVKFNLELFETIADIVFAADWARRFEQAADVRQLPLRETVIEDAAHRAVFQMQNEFVQSVFIVASGLVYIYDFRSVSHVSITRFHSLDMGRMLHPRRVLI